MDGKISVGSAPWGVTPAQLGTVGYELRAEKECTAYIQQLVRLYAEAHAGAALPCALKIDTNRHDFGTYYDVVALVANQADVTAALWLENHMPEDWDHVAAAELGLAPGDDLVY